MTRIVLGISGWKSSGKDTTSDFLVQEYGFTKLSFAKSLKDSVAQTYGVPRDWFDSSSHKETALTQYPVIATDSFSSAMQDALSMELCEGFWTPRALCILEGTAKRAVHANFWIRKVVDIILGLPDMDFVISDMRYQSEADTLKMLIPGLKTVRINRYDSIATKDPSERDLDNYKFNYVLDNTKTVEELYNQICNIPELALDDLEDR